MITYEEGNFKEISDKQNIPLFKFAVENSELEYQLISQHYNYERILEHHNAQTIVAKVDDQIVGWNLWRSAEFSGLPKQMPEIETKVNELGYQLHELFIPVLLVVHKDYRGQGLASIMTEKAFERAKTLGFKGKINFAYASLSGRQTNIKWVTEYDKTVVSTGLVDYEGYPIEIFPIN